MNMQYFREIDIQSGILAFKGGVRSGIPFSKMAKGTDRFLMLGWHIPNQDLVMCPPGFVPIWNLIEMSYPLTRGAQHKHHVGILLPDQVVFDHSNRGQHDLLYLPATTSHIQHVHCKKITSYEASNKIQVLDNSFLEAILTPSGKLQYILRDQRSEIWRLL